MNENQATTETKDCWAAIERAKCELDKVTKPPVTIIAPLRLRGSVFRGLMRAGVDMPPLSPPFIFGKFQMVVYYRHAEDRLEIIREERLRGNRVFELDECGFHELELETTG